MNFVRESTVSTGRLKAGIRPRPFLIVAAMSASETDFCHAISDKSRTPIDGFAILLSGSSRPWQPAQKEFHEARGSGARETVTGVDELTADLDSVD